MTQPVKKQWSGKSRGGHFGYWFFMRLVHMVGIRCAYCFLAFVVVYFIPFAPKATRSIWHYNRRIRRLGILSSLKELYCHYYVFGQTLIDKVAIRGGLADKYRFEFDNYGRFLEIINGTQGVVMIGAHVGCWEAGAGFFGKYGKKINIVMLDAEHQQIKDVLEENAGQSNNYKVIDISRDPLETMLRIKAALDAGEYICFNGDRYIDPRTSAEYPFMGATAMFPEGPFRIAAKCRVPVVFYFAMREADQTYRFIFHEADIYGKTSAVELTEQYIATLETVMRRYPRQWFNFYEYWQ